MRRRHTCEVMNYSLWSTLPQEMVERVLACLPIEQLVTLRRCSQLWSNLLTSPDFRRECSRRHPKLFGLVGWKEYYDSRAFCTLVHDIESNEWGYGESLGGPGSNLHDDPPNYEYADRAWDGGLVCFVPGESMSSHPILVGNPLTDEWRKLPRIPLDMQTSRGCFLCTQLVMEEDGKSYRVIIVSRYFKLSNPVPGHSVLRFDSKTGLWTAMLSRQVGAIMRTFMDCPCVVDLETSKVHELSLCPALKSLDMIGSAILKDHLFVLHECSSGVSPHKVNRLKISEYECQSSTSDLRRLRIIDVTLPKYVEEMYDHRLFAWNGFLLLIADNREEEEDEDPDLVISLYDSCRNEWQNPSMEFSDFTFKFTEELESVFMCELRWDVVP